MFRTLARAPLSSPQRKLRLRSTGSPPNVDTSTGPPHDLPNVNRFSWSLSPTPGDPVNRFPSIVDRAGHSREAQVPSSSTGSLSTSQRRPPPFFFVSFLALSPPSRLKVNRPSSVTAPDARHTPTQRSSAPSPVRGHHHRLHRITTTTTVKWQQLVGGAKGDPRRLDSLSHTQQSVFTTPPTEEARPLVLFSSKRISKEDPPPREDSW